MTAGGERPQSTMELSNSDAARLRAARNAGHTRLQACRRHVRSSSMREVSRLGSEAVIHQETPCNLVTFRSLVGPADLLRTTVVTRLARQAEAWRRTLLIRRKRTPRVRHWQPDLPFGLRNLYQRWRFPRPTFWEISMLLGSASLFTPALGKQIAHLRPRGGTAMTRTSESRGGVLHT